MCRAAGRWPDERAAGPFVCHADFSLAGHANLIEAMARLQKDLGRTLASTDDRVLEPPEVRGAEAFGDSWVLLEIETRCRPGTHLKVARKLRLELKKAFDRHGIEIPYARRVIYQGGAWPVRPSGDPLREAGA